MCNQYDCCLFFIGRKDSTPVSIFPDSFWIFLILSQQPTSMELFYYWHRIRNENFRLRFFSRTRFILYFGQKRYDFRTSPIQECVFYTIYGFSWPSYCFFCLPHAHIGRSLQCVIELCPHSVHCPLKYVARIRSWSLGRFFNDSYCEW